MTEHSDPTQGQPGGIGGLGSDAGTGGTGGVGGAGGIGLRGKTGLEGLTGQQGRQGIQGEPGDNSHAIKITDRRLLFMMAFVIFISVVLGLRSEANNRSISRNQHTVDVRTYTSCQASANNIKRFNTFAVGQARLEATNRFIDNKLRAGRVKLYHNLILTLPNCGPKP